MKAILLAGGLGTRLSPLTSTCPKPMLPVGNLPVIERTIISLRKQGVREFIFLLHYLPEVFVEYFGTGKKFDACFKFEIIKQNLNTAGCVKHIRDSIQETSLVYSGDILADLPVQKMLAFHHSKKALVTIALHSCPIPLAYGIVAMNKNNRIIKFREKPMWPQVFSDWINGGIYVIEPELIDQIPNDGEPVSFEKAVFPQLSDRGAAIYGFPLKGYWRDVGAPENLLKANMDYLDRQLPKILLTESEAKQRETFSSSQTVVGHSNHIADSAEILHSAIGNRCRIAGNTRLSNCLVLDGSLIEKNAIVDSAIVAGDIKILGESNHQASSQGRESARSHAANRSDDLTHSIKNGYVEKSSEKAGIDFIYCPNEMKAKVMRRLLELFDENECEIEQGVRIKMKSGGIVVQPCGEIEAIRISQESNTLSPGVHDLYQEVKDRVSELLAEMNNIKDGAL